MSGAPFVTIAVPSYNQGRYLEDAFRSIFQQEPPVEVFVADGGSQDDSVEIIRKWEGRLSGWRSFKDSGQAAAINECIARGSAPYVCWLNSDDLLEPGGLEPLIRALEDHPHWPAVYGRAWNVSPDLRLRTPVWVEPFSERRLAIRCIISQPATLMRRSVWESLGGLDESLYLAMDYDLWWRVFKQFGPLGFVDQFVAANRNHGQTKTRLNRRRHYREAMSIVRKYYGKVPMKWYLAQPYAVWLKSLVPWHG